MVDSGFQGDGRNNTSTQRKRSAPTVPCADNTRTTRKDRAPHPRADVIDSRTFQAHQVSHVNLVVMASEVSIVCIALRVNQSGDVVC